MWFFIKFWQCIDFVWIWYCMGIVDNFQKVVNDVGDANDAATSIQVHYANLPDFFVIFIKGGSFYPTVIYYFGFPLFFPIDIINDYPISVSI